MNNAATRGQPRALAEVDSMILGRPPHAVLLVGPGSVGKTTLALDLAGSVGAAAR
jgi:DNA helicase TIP49 (TBP-interacting protein)